MLMGVFVGDALGAPHERRYKAQYTGRIEHRAKIGSRYHPTIELAVGQGTDDSEMVLALLRCLISHRGYDRDKVVLAYMQWANSGGRMLGKNTRQLFVGIKTLRGYEGRIAKVLVLPEEQRSQSSKLA
jgi:ADP-ribosyl-[dinitrogen reductase] hydrolase